MAATRKTATNSNTKKAALPALDLGVAKEQLPGITAILKTLLADEVILYTRLRNYHWNVNGPHFYPLHQLFEAQYDEVEDIIDDVAERIRQFGVTAPGTLAEFQQMARLKEQPGEVPAAMAMVATLAADHEALVRFLREDIETIDDEADEVGVEDLLTGLLQQHQKMAWMLRATAEAAS
jgi:starvation-inducible DNA-binding protein